MPVPTGPQFTGPFFHGSPAVFQPGDHVRPGLAGFSSAATDRAKAEPYAYGAGRVYEVEPMDPNDLKQGLAHEWEVTSESGFKVIK
jgi:hypothetical protein